MLPLPESLTTYRLKLAGARCGQVDHDSQVLVCKIEIKCIYCKCGHFACSCGCAKWKIEKQVPQVRVVKRLSFQEARMLVETPIPSAVVGQSYTVAIG